jgi:hypothetical protein
MQFDAKTAQAVRGFIALEDREKALEARMERLSKKTENQAKRTKDAFGDRAQQMVKRFATGLVGAGGLAGAYQLISKEIQRVIALQNKMAQQQVTLASARRDLKRNLLGATDAEISGVIQAAGKISEDTGVEEKFVTGALSQALSASGGNRAASIRAVRRASRIMADRPEAIAGLAGSLLDLSRVTGTTDAAINAGLQAAVGARGRIVDPQQQARNIPRALIGLKAQGFGAAGGGALFASMTTGAGDLTGESTGTAVISLAQQANKFFRGRLRGEEALQALMADPRLAQRFLQQATFEKKFAGPMQQFLLDPESQIRGEFLANRAAFGSQADLARMANEQVRQLESGELERTARVGRIFATTLGQQLTADPRAGRIGKTRAGLIEAIEQSGAGFLERRARRAEFERLLVAGEDPEAAAVEVLRARRAKLAEEAGGALVAQGFGEAQPNQVWLEKTNRQIELLEQLITKLDQSREDANTKRNTMQNEPQQD